MDTLIGALLGVSLLLVLTVIVGVPLLAVRALYRRFGQPMPAVPPLAFVLTLAVAAAYLVSLD